MNEQEETEQAEEVSPEIVEEATSLGWVPKDKWRGKESDWSPADEFVEKGRHVLPIMAENNKRLRADLLTRDAKIATLESAVANSEKAIAALEKHFTAANKAQVVQAKKDLMEQIRVARESGDVDGEFALVEQLESVRVDEKAATASQEKKEETPNKQEDNSKYLTPDVIQWGKDNPWYESDKKLQKMMDRTCQDLRDDGETATGAEFLELARKEMEARRDFWSGYKKPPASKVEGGAPGRGGNTGNSSKSFNSLPADARKACHEDNDILVGTGKKYKNVKDWEDAYAKIYYGED